MSQTGVFLHMGWNTKLILQWQ